MALPLFLKAAPRATPPVWLLVLITISGTMAMHMFVPALPYAAKDLSASIAEMQLTISLYIIGLAVGQLFYGPLSDALGRKPMLMAGLALYTVAGFAAALAPGLHMLVMARLAQALGGCAGLVLGRAIVRDTTHADKAIRQMALMNLMMMIGPGLAPVIGGAISATLGWRAIFGLLGTLGAAALVLTWRLLPETTQPSGRFNRHVLVADYGRLLRSPRFVGFAFGGGCATTSIYAFIATAPFIFVTQLHRPLHEVGYYLGFLVMGMGVGNWVTSRLAARVPTERLLLGGSAVCMASALILLTTIASGHLNFTLMMTLMFVYTCGAGLSSPAALIKSVSVDPKLIGSASGLYGFSQMAVAAVCTTLAGLGSNPALSAIGVLAAASTLGQIGFWIGLSRERAARAAAIGA